MVNFIEMVTTLDPVGLLIVTLIVGILILAFIVNIILIGCYSKLESDLQNNDHKDKRQYNSDMLNFIVRDYTDASSNHYGEINTQAIIEKNFSRRMKAQLLGERFVKTSISLMIILGLVGTFFGLTISISKLVSLLSTDASNALSGADSITDSLINALSGMSVAFVTSLFGISSSIIMTLLNLLFNAPDKRVSVMSQIEEYLDNRLFKEVREDYFKYQIKNAATKEAKSEAEALAYPDVSMHRLYTVSKELSSAANAIIDASGRFEHSLGIFGESARDFKEFNYHLKDNIQRMSVSFSDLNENLKTTKDQD